jgi:hypothetical protein
MQMTKPASAHLFLLGIGLLLGGCVSLPWQPTAGVYSSPKENFAVELPSGWMRLNAQEDVLVTRDGLLLQHMSIERALVDKPLKNTKKTLTRGMQPQAVAEVIIDNFVSSDRMLDVKILENRPVQVAQQRGFRLVYTHRDKNGLRFKSVLHGFLVGDVFYAIRYTAAERYYFAKDLPAYEQVLASFRLIRPA